MSAEQPILEVTDLVVEHGTGRRRKRAVDGVSFEIPTGTTLGLVGESGSGKTTTGMAILGMLPMSGGRVLFEGRDITRMPRRERCALGSQRQVIFQDPYSSLDPSKTIGYTLAEPCRVAPREHRMTTAAIADRSAMLLQRVGLSPDAARRYPAQFSGGQRQRIAIARSLMLSPRLIVCDEPVSALDLSVQAEVLNLLSELQQDLGLSLLFISHDLSVVRHISHAIVVLQGGRIVEKGSADQVYERPRERYTQTLLAAAPVPDPAEQRARREERQRRRIEERQQ
ncbi:ATP-binding cassette domain-containing protein [Microbacterium sp. STN6]|uniref:ATP-binding cassette domain-containing protein n=1 Tax=Microbacterium sp. STN6 TaxID=2995588 RepID=UPI002260E6A4|nr:ATP-binding cassette domain-containing protein [Microbacterium sp. STN6]MCX7520700.1 ATP-binding cassette domain-containing protein [Microbacterium sp. STN6]